MFSKIESYKIFFIFIVLVLFLSPIVVIGGAWFTPAGEGMGHLVDTVLPRYLSNTIILLFGTGALTFIIGVGTAWLVTAYRFSGDRLFSWSLFLPLAIPTYVAAFIYGGLLDYPGSVQTTLREMFAWEKNDYVFPNIRSLGGAIFVMSFVLFPYVYMLSRIAFMAGRSTVDVGRVYGLSMWRIFLTIGIPLARPAIIAGLALVSMETLADFGAVQHLAVDTFTTGIYRTWFSMSDPIVAARLATILLLFVASIIFLERRSRGPAKYYAITAPSVSSEKIRLSGMQNILASLCCFVPLALGFIIPIFQLAAWTFDNLEVFSSEDFVTLLGNSVSVSVLATIFTLVIATIFAYILRFDAREVLRNVIRFTSMGYVVPGSVLAVGIIIFFGWLDHRLDSLFESGLLFSGTIFALVFAYVFRFLAVALSSVESGLENITSEIHWASQLFGLKRLSMAMKVHIPIIRHSVLVAGLLVFVECVKELPATLIVRPFNFDTLATHTFELASDERLAESAPYALVIVLLGMISVLLVSVMLSVRRH